MGATVAKIMSRKDWFGGAPFFAQHCGDGIHCIEFFFMKSSDQQNIFDAAGNRSAVVEPLAEVTARRMQALLKTFPIHQMVARGESGHHPHWHKQNFTFLALQAFDAVFARMSPGVGRGASRDQIVEDLRPFILGSDPSLSEDHVSDIADFVISQLMNEGRGPFKQTCIWAEERGRSVKPYPYRFALLEAFHDQETDRFLIRATSHAIHLYLRMLDQPLEDEQLANLFILQEQVKRGRIDRARREAERTMLLSLEYERYIFDMLRAVRRDVTSVDWVKEVTPKLEEAHSHVQRLIQDQSKVLVSLKGELQKYEEGARLNEIHDLIALLESCQKRHMDLERQILAAGPEFLEEQAYQRFRQMARSPTPDLNQQIFMPGLRLDQKVYRPLVRPLFHAVLGAEIEKLLDVELFLERLLREDVVHESRPDEEDAEERSPIGELFDPIRDMTEMKIADVLLAVDEKGWRLSQVLARGRELGLETKELAALGVSILHSYHARSDVLGLTVSKDGAHLDDPEFEGDDLVIARILPDEAVEEVAKHDG